MYGIFDDYALKSVKVNLPTEKWGDLLMVTIS